jgi:hypothetical protein
MFKKTMLMNPIDGKEKRLELAENILANADTINVVITTYTIAKTAEDLKFLRRLKPCVSKTRISAQPYYRTDNLR